MRGTGSLSARASAARTRFAARNADVIFSAHGTDFDDAPAFAEDIRTRLRAAGRPDDDLRILPGSEIIIGATEAEAQEKKRCDPPPTGHPRYGVGDRRAVGYRPVRPRPRRAAACGGSGRQRERRLLRCPADRRPAPGGGRMAGEGTGPRLVAARDRHRARPAASPRRHPVRTGRQVRPLRTARRDRRVQRHAVPHPRRPRRHRRPARPGAAGTRALPHRLHRQHAPRPPRAARTPHPPVRTGPAAGRLTTTHS
ncbi:LLM class flavin-dependent oxidoreductase [Streptomyces sp. NPDC001537]